MRIYAALDQIKDNRYQARVEYGDLGELAADIQRQAAARPDTRGLQQVPSARLIGDDGEWVPMTNLEPGDFLDKGQLRKGWSVELEFGHRRKRAFGHLAAGGAYEYNVMPLDLRDLTDDQMLDGVWQENRSRRDLSSVEEAELLARKVAQVGNQRLAAEAWGIARATVANKLALLELPEEIRQANRDGRLSERAALSLAPVVAISQNANGVEWNSATGYYGAPQSPAAFIQSVVAADSKITSEDIRSYTKRALSHAGTELPAIIADFRATQGGGIIRATCAGCPKRINTTCLAAGCLENKIEEFEARLIEETAAVLGIPFSDRAEDFEFKSEEYGQLLALWLAGGARPGMDFVFGVKMGYAVRPFADPPACKHLAGYNRWEGDGRGIIAIGYRGRLPGELAAGNDKPDKSLLQEWAKRAGQIRIRCRRQAREAITELLLDDVQDFRLIMYLAQPVEQDEEKLAGALTKWLWERGEWASRAESGEPAEQIDAIEVMLDAVGIGRGILQLSLAERAVLWLFYYWHYQEWSWAKDKIRRASQEVEALRGLFAGVSLDGEMAVLNEELARAARDAGKASKK